MITQDNLQRTPLYDEHIHLNAKMVSFGGWMMPVQYEGILKEHRLTRTEAAIFDISHMGEFIIEGDCVASGLDRLVTMPLTDLPVKTCRYGCLLNARGGVMDDLIVFRMEDQKWFVVVNAATSSKDAAHFQKHLFDGAVFRDVSLRTGKIDIQGPQSREVLSSLVEGIEKLGYYTFDFFELLGEYVLISRTGYTGELGYEIFFPWEKTPALWRALMAHPKVKPAGLGARDILRVEMGYSLYGHELGEDISPLESGLGRFIDFQKEFIGKDALLKQQEEGLKKKLVGIASGNRKAPRQGHQIFSAAGNPIGEVTSGTFSPELNFGIGLGFVAAAEAGLGTAVFFGDEKIRSEGKLAARNFFKGGSLRS